MKIQHAVKKLDDVKHKISKYDAELKMSRAEAEMAQLSHPVPFQRDNRLRAGRAGPPGPDRQEPGQRYEWRPTSQAKGLEEIQPEVAVEKTMAEDALREFEVSQGAGDAGDDQVTPVDQGAGPRNQDSGPASRDLRGCTRRQ